ncbi:MAG: T9SS type A sorting domain-containing protein [Bacteroidetes bacterium]|nr:T9SS type A sorting domain-containing protein [Bacteroidota bacterium]
MHFKNQLLWVFFYFSFTSLQSQDLVPANQTHLIGYWKFQDKNNLTKATVGNNLILTGKHDMVNGASYGDTAIRIGIGSYYTFDHKIKANGGGALVNQYTLMFDFKVLNFNKWHTFFQLDSTNKNDGECFIRPKTGSGPGRIGVAATSYTNDSINPKQWYRLVISVNNGNFYRYYLNGQLILEGDTQDIDGRFSLGTQILFFADENQEDDTIDIASLAMFDTCLSSAQIAAIGTIEPCIAYPPKPKLGSDTVLCAGTSIVKNAGNGYAKYSWSTGAKSASAALDLNRLKIGKNTVWVKVTDMNNCEGTDTMILTFVPLPLANAGSDTSVCSGNFVDFIANADTTLNYQWRKLPGINIISTKNHLIADSTGKYTVTVTNTTGCKSMDTVELQVNATPPKPTIQNYGKTEFCEYDSLKLSAPNGYSKYFWNETELTQDIYIRNSGSWKLRIEDGNGCSSETSDSVITTAHAKPKQIILNQYNDTGFCENKSVVLHVKHGFQKYIWQDGPGDSIRIINSIGNYYVAVEDSNGCRSNNSNAVNVVQFPTPIKPGIFFTGSTNFCSGDSLLLNASAGFTGYEWNNLYNKQILVVKTNGNFLVRGKNKYGCFGPWSDSVKIQVNALPAKPHIQQSGYDTLFSVETGNGYNWLFNSNTAGSGKFLKVAQEGNYNLRIYNGNCWSAWSDTFQFIFNNSPDFILKKVFYIFPIPSTNMLNIENINEKVIQDIFLYDFAGKCVLHKNYHAFQNANTISFPLESLPNGTYILQINTTDGIFKDIVIKE